MQKKMKKIVLLAVAVMFTVAAHSQVVVGLQGGFHQQTYNNPNYRIDLPTPGGTTILDTKNTAIVGGLQVGYQVLPKLYVGVVGQYFSNSGFSNLKHDSLQVNELAHSSFAGMTLKVYDHQFRTMRSGWNAALQVKYEFVRYGNMHFNILLQAGYGSMGETTIDERYTKSEQFMSTTNNEVGEVVDFDPEKDGVTNTTLDISLRPTLVYEFSTHLSAELSLDFLSLGYISDTRHVGNDEIVIDPVTKLPVNVIPAHDETTNTMYAGLNTLMQTLAWESPMLRLGFNWKF